MNSYSALPLPCGRPRLIVTMVAAVSLLVVVTVSILITRIATIMLTHTGLSQETARFRARSAISGRGCSTAKAERVVRHPLRRRIVLVLTLLRNVGVVVRFRR